MDVPNILRCYPIYATAAKQKRGVVAPSHRSKAVLGWRRAPRGKLRLKESCEFEILLISPERIFDATCALTTTIAPRALPGEKKGRLRNGSSGKALRPGRLFLHGVLQARRADHELPREGGHDHALQELRVAVEHLIKCR